MKKNKKHPKPGKPEEKTFMDEAFLPLLRMALSFQLAKKEPPVEEALSAGGLLFRQL